MLIHRFGRQVVPFDLAVAAGHISGAKAINKFGHATDCDLNTPTDIWDGADGVLSTDIWVPPTTARTHQIKSSSENDAAAGSGVRTLKVYGLTDWDTPEINETVTLNGTNDVATTNDYVIIHRMQAQTWGAGGVAAGNITATADTDATITAIIPASNNQTEMLIYGWSSKEDLYMCQIRSRLYGGPATTVTVTGDVYVMPDPGTNAVNNTAWVNKENLSMTGNEREWRHQYCVPRKFPGPGILKMQVVSNTNNIACVGTFDGIVLRND